MMHRFEGQSPRIFSSPVRTNALYAFAFVASVCNSDSSVALSNRAIPAPVANMIWRVQKAEHDTRSELSRFNPSLFQLSDAQRLQLRKSTGRCVFAANPENGTEAAACSCALVGSNDVVVTAAHCLIDKQGRDRDLARSYFQNFAVPRDPPFAFSPVDGDAIVGIRNIAKSMNDHARVDDFLVVRLRQPLKAAEPFRLPESALDLRPPQVIMPIAAQMEDWQGKDDELIAQECMIRDAVRLQGQSYYLSDCATHRGASGGVDFIVDGDNLIPVGIETASTAAHSPFREAYDASRNSSYTVAMSGPFRAAIEQLSRASKMKGSGKTAAQSESPALQQVKQLRCGAGIASPLHRVPEPLTRDEECALKSGDQFRECPDCPVMVVIPSGSFLMGSPDGEDGPDKLESPQHRVTIAKPFAIGKFVATFDDWDACVADHGCEEYSPSPKARGRGSRPVTNVSWDDAKSYVIWLSKKTGQAYRLLSEAEWEYSARGGSSSPYWWGVAFADGEKLRIRREAFPIGSLRPNPFGLGDLNGNVRQWVEDCWHGNYVAAPTDGSAWTNGNCANHVIRGASFRDDYGWPFRSAYRSRTLKILRGSDEIGIRVSRSLKP